MPSSDKHLIWADGFVAKVRARLALFFGVTMVQRLLRLSVFLLPQQALIPIGNGVPVFLRPSLVESVTEPLPDRKVDHIGGHYISPYEAQRQRALDALREGEKERKAAEIRTRNEE